jgi:hypothetical protein
VPITYQIDRDGRRLRTRCFGEVAFGEVIEHFRELAGGSALPAGSDVLLDLSGLTSAPDPQQILEVAAEADRSLAPLRLGRCAIVATRDLVFGISRVFEVRTEEVFTATRVFRSLADAEAWLASG